MLLYICSIYFWITDVKVKIICFMWLKKGSKCESSANTNMLLQTTRKKEVPLIICLSCHCLVHKVLSNYSCNGGKQCKVQFIGMQKKVLWICSSEDCIIYPDEEVEMIVFLTVATILQTLHLPLAAAGLCSGNTCCSYFIMPKIYF